MWKKRCGACLVVFREGDEKKNSILQLGLSKTRNLVSSFHVEIIFYYTNLYYIILLGREGAPGHHNCYGSEEGSG